jgi:hypothetical protein
MLAVAAAGSWVAVASSCDVRVADLVRGSRPTLISAFGRCREEDTEAAVYDLYLGKTTIVAETVLAPSPHGEEYSLWSGALPRGPMHPLGGEWGWRDDPAFAYGCDWTIAAGGGTVALAQIPNRLGPSAKPACAGAATATRILLRGSRPAEVTLGGSWAILATDGRRIALAELGGSGSRTGRLSLVDVEGRELAAPRVDSATVRTALRGWLTPQGLVLETRNGISAPGWTIHSRGIGSVTVAEGRLFYVIGRTVRVRRLPSGVDRALVTVPTSETLLAAGSFGLAVGVGTDYEKTTVYRLPWSMIDRTLPDR